MKTVVLISPTPISQVPTGLAYIGAIFENQGWRVKPLVNTFKYYFTMEELVEKAASCSPDLIGISFSSFRVLDIYDLVARLKKLGVPVIIGGPHPTLFPEEGVEHGADVAVVGEGEATAEEMAKYYDGRLDRSLAQIPGIVFRDDSGKIRRTAPREPIQDLDAIPFPALHLFDEETFRQPDGTLKGFNKVFFSRGCPARCTFCETNAFGRKYRCRNAEDVVKEIENVKAAYGIDEFTFIDDLFTVNKALIKQICGLLIERQVNVQWIAACKISTVDEALLREMHRAGCIQVNYGIESGDEDTLKRIKKGIKLEAVRRVVKLTHQIGIRIYANIMTGFPFETVENVMNTRNLVKELSPYVYMYSVHGCLVPYPGTEIYQEFKDQRGIDHYWLRPEYQLMGDVIYQNVPNPYEVSTYYQRNMYDDTYIEEETFFSYSREIKRANKKLVFAIGWHNMKVRHPNRLRRLWAMGLCYLSNWVYQISPRLEKGIARRLRLVNRIHDNLKIGYMVRLGPNRSRPERFQLWKRRLPQGQGSQS